MGFERLSDDVIYLNEKCVFKEEFEYEIVNVNRKY